LRRRIEKLLSSADVAIDGARPWDLQLRDERLFARVLIHGSLGLGESYMDGWWECGRLDEFFYRVLRAELDSRVAPWIEVLEDFRARLLNLQRPGRAFQVGQRHYDTGNELYAGMLGERMIYSCGYWRDASTLDQAQEAKLTMICRKLDLRPGMRLLDIGCGWGGLAKFAAERYGVSAVGITVSREQMKLGRQLCRGFDVDIRLQDYRNLSGEFDRVVSVGMFEHVGWKNYSTFMRVVRNHTRDDGLFLLHVIGGNRAQTTPDPWTGRYIFPNSMLPSAGQIGASIEGTFVLEDWHSFGAHYDRTLMEWYRNFDEHWPSLKDRYGERFYRMWKYYLLSFAGSFRARKNQVWEIVLSPHGIPGGYCRSRVHPSLRPEPKS